jgi:hypothetical protein
MPTILNISEHFKVTTHAMYVERVNTSTALSLLEDFPGE